MTLSEYTRLFQEIVLNVGKSENHSHLLSKLKEFYKDDIDSDRRFELINTIGQLLKILEIRDILSENDVTPLKEIARRLGNNELLKSLTEYEVNHATRDYVNCYAHPHEMTFSTHKEIKENTASSHPFGTLTATKRQRINEKIIEEIGIYWRPLARNLKIQESKIDEIDNMYQNSNDKIKEMLELYYTKKADPQRWFFVLCDAIEKTRRKDLSKGLQEIMAMNI